MHKLIFAVLVAVCAQTALAESFFCRTIKVGCYTEKEREIEMQRCRNLANEIYTQALSEALADPTKWQFNGNTSAQDYALMRKRSVFGTCIQNSRALSN